MECGSLYRWILVVSETLLRGSGDARGTASDVLPASLSRPVAFDTWMLNSVIGDQSVSSWGPRDIPGYAKMFMGRVCRLLHTPRSEYLFPT